MELLAFIFILGNLFSFSNSAELKYECPEPEDIFPCYCEEDDGDPSVFCNHITTPKQIYDGVKGLKGYKIYKMSFFMNWILDPIKPDVFENLYIERVFFENSTITLTAPQFQGLEKSLNSIQLRAIFNKTNPLVPLDLAHLSQLREIMFEKNRITTLPNDWVKSVPDSVRTVSVEENTIITLEDEVFAKMKRLTFLILESNRIVLIKRSMFPRPAESLRSLNINNNRIRYLPNDIFSEMPNLRGLEMAGNRLTTLDENVWSGIVSQLTKLDISNNPMECDNTLKWIVNSRKPSMMFGKCQEPEDLRGRTILSLQQKDLS